MYILFSYVNKDVLILLKNNIKYEVIILFTNIILYLC